MFDLNEELIVEGYNVTWLIWFQLLVTILLLFVFFCGFSIFSGDLSTNPTSFATTSSFPTNPSISASNKSIFNGSASIQVEEIHRVQSDMDASTSKVIFEEQSLERVLSAKDAALVRPFGRANHPCSYFGFAKTAILKCLGLDALFESSQKRRHKKDD